MRRVEHEEVEVADRAPHGWRPCRPAGRRRHAAPSSCEALPSRPDSPGTSVRVVTPCSRQRHRQRAGHVGQPAGLDQRKDFGRDGQNLHHRRSRCVRASWTPPPHFRMGEDRRDASAPSSPSRSGGEVSRRSRDGEGDLFIACYRAAMNSKPQPVDHRLGDQADALFRDAEALGVEHRVLADDQAFGNGPRRGRARSGACARCGRSRSRAASPPRPALE